MKTLTKEKETIDYQPIEFIKTKKEAAAIIGGELRNNKKMPCKTFNLSAWHCKTGGLLAEKPGTICFECYARNGHYLMFRDDHAKGYSERLKNVDSIYWIDAMIKQIGNDPFFRWFASGDLQSLAMLEKIVIIARALPDTRFWLPTHEPGIIKSWLEKHQQAFPDNLIIRISAVYIDKPADLPKSLQGHKNILTSTVHTIAPIQSECPSHLQNGECRDCRNCWNTEVKNVSYKAH
jgi:hypothetical protein